jgi:flagellar biosynthetic protein FliR
MHFTGAEISGWVGSFFWPFTRIGAMLTVAPVFGSLLVPVRVRLGIALVLTMVVAPVLPPMPQVDPLTASGVMILAQQFLIGLALGFVLQLVFGVFGLVGEIISMPMGLGFASMVDPQNGVSLPILGQFYALLATLTFLSFNGHLMWIGVMADSFRVVPVGTDGMTAQGVWLVAAFAGDMFSWAVRLALPVMAALLVVNVSFGVLTRAAPQLNIFSVGFPAALFLGFVLIGITLPAVLNKMMPITLDGLARVSAALGGR